MTHCPSIFGAHVSLPLAFTFHLYLCLILSLSLSVCLSVLSLLLITIPYAMTGMISLSSSLCAASFLRITP